MKPVYFILAICLVFSLFTGCRKNKSPYMSETAVIIGVDPTLCGCCGGLMINFNNNPAPPAGEISLIRKMPDNSDIDLHSAFPIYVKVSWEDVGMCGPREIINITKLKRR